MKRIIKDIRTLIATNRLEEALDRFILASTKTPHRQTAIMLSLQWHQLLSEYNQKRCSLKQFQRRTRTIASQVLEILSSFEEK